MNKRWLLAEKAFTVISLLHFSGAPLVVILSGGASEGDNSGGTSDFALIQMLFLLIYLITFCLLFLRWKRVIPVITKCPLVWILVVIAMLSFYWSASPSITKSRVIALVGTMLFSVYLGSRYTLKEQLELLGWTFGIAIIMSLLFIFGLPKYGKMTGVHWGSWRGIYNHKNVLGKVMAPSALFFLLLALKGDKNRWLFWLGVMFSIIFIIRSRSSSSLINLIIMSVSLLGFRILRWRYDFLIPTLLGISTLSIISYTLFTSNAAAIAAFFGKDLTLTGRTNFWPFLLDRIWQRPWFGYGYGAFWQGFDGPSDYIWYSYTFKAPNSHNGYIDLVLELGLVGLSLYLVQYLIGFQKALTHIRLTKTYDGFWPIVFLLYIILSNLTESTLFIQNNFFLTIQIAIFFSLGTHQD